MPLGERNLSWDAFYLRPIVIILLLCCYSDNSLLHRGKRSDQPRKSNSSGNSDHFFLGIIFFPITFYLELKRPSELDLPCLAHKWLVIRPAINDACHDRPVRSASKTHQYDDSLDSGTGYTSIKYRIYYWPFPDRKATLSQVLRVIPVPLITQLLICRSGLLLVKSVKLIQAVISHYERIYTKTSCRSSHFKTSTSPMNELCLSLSQKEPLSLTNQNLHY